MQVLSWIASHCALPKVHVCLPYRSLNCMQMGVLQIFATLKCFSSSILYLSESCLNALVSAKTLLPNRSIRGVLTSVLCTRASKSHCLRLLKPSLDKPRNDFLLACPSAAHCSQRGGHHTQLVRHFTAQAPCSATLSDQKTMRIEGLVSACKVTGCV